MKLLINLCAHDGIISYYTGVGTMVKRYIKMFTLVLDNLDIDYDINLFTPEYNEDSFGYNKNVALKHSKLKIYQISNGTNGKVNYGTPDDWKKLVSNTAKVINSLDLNCYDKVFTIYNDTPFACLAKLLNHDENHKKVWIPHSTVKIHEVDSAIENSHLLYNDRLDWEQSAIDYANSDDNSYIGMISEFMRSHLIYEYNLKEEKAIDIINGELLDEKDSHKFSKENKKLFKQIEDKDEILLSYSRAEKYKNLEATMELGKALNIPTVVIAQSYYKEQPILDEYRKTASYNNTNLFIDPSFDFSKYIINNFSKNIILLIPSKRESMGLIANEIRKLNKDNILLVANDIGPFREQIDDLQDGILVDLDNIECSALKIRKYFNDEYIKKINKNGQITLREKYDFRVNVEKFLKCLMEI